MTRRMTLKVCWKMEHKLLVISVSALKRDHIFKKRKKKKKLMIIINPTMFICCDSSRVSCNPVL